jgi:hypothetical protein
VFVYSVFVHFRLFVDDWAIRREVRLVPDSIVPAGVPSSAGEALAMVLNGLKWLAQAELASVPAAAQADALRGLEDAESLLTAARAALLSAFDRGRGFESDGHGTARSWLRWQSRVSNGAASGSVGWMRRLRSHRLVADALAAAGVSASWARHICGWTDPLPQGKRDQADAILLQAAADGADLADLAVLAEEIRARLAEPDKDGPDYDGRNNNGPGGDGSGGDGPGGDPDGGGPGGGGPDGGGPDGGGPDGGGPDGGGGPGGDGPDGGGPGGDGPAGGAGGAGRDGKLWLGLTIGGAGRLEGDLSPGCAAALRAVLDSLGKKAGPEDTRTAPERHHDALHEALRRLLAAGGLPARAGQPVQIQLHITLEELLRRLHPHPRTSPPGSPGPGPGSPGPRSPGPRSPGPGSPGPGGGGAWPAGWPLAAPGEECDASLAPIVTGALDHDLLQRLTQALTPGGTRPGNPDSDTIRDLIIANAAALLSGPRGLASWFRRELAGPAGSASLPLDTGTSTETIPPHLRRAVTHRDQHCTAPGCDQPPPACQVHHITPTSQGGTTKLTNLILLCTFHHLILIHKWGWTITLNPDGTTTMTSPDGKRVFHSHSPPAADADA